MMSKKKQPGATTAPLCRRVRWLQGLFGVKERGPPTFYLHVGLHKTGTTFLQTAYCRRNTVTEPLFLQDNLVYLGTCPGGFTKNFVNHKSSAIFHPNYQDTAACYLNLTERGHLPELTDEEYVFDTTSRFLVLVEKLKDQVARGERAPDVLMVFEDFSCFTDKMLRQFKDYLSPIWNFEVLIVHRDFHDWFLSWHFQYHKLLPRHITNWNKWIDPIDLENPKLSSTKLFHSIEKNKLHPAHLVRELYRRHFDSVQVAFLSEITSKQRQSSARRGDPLSEYILCHFVNDAPNACQQERRGKIGKQVRLKNSQKDFTFDLMAQEAHSRGLVPDKSKRLEVASFIEANVRSNPEMGKFAQICPSDDILNRLERLSIEVDQKMYSEKRWTGRRKKIHAATFKEIVDGKKMCFVDTEKVFKDAKWNSFFKEELWV